MPPRIPKSVRVHGLDFPVWSLGDERFATQYMLGSRRIVIKRRTLNALRYAIEHAAVGKANADTAALDMTADERRIYIAARTALEPVGIAVDSAAHIVAEAAGILGSPQDIIAAAKYWLARNPQRIATPPTAQIVAELLAQLADKGRSRIYLTRLRRDLERFATAHAEMAGLSEHTLAAYLRALPSGPRRRDNVRDAIVTLSRFARSRHYLPDDQRTAAEKVERINPGVEVETWTPKEIALLLEHVSDRWRPLLAIGAFAGMRTSEIFRLEWKSVKWEQRVIAVSSKVAKKVRTSRLIPMSDNLLAWLAPWRDAVGALYPNRETHRIGPAWATLEHHRGMENKRLQKLTGIRWQDNALRHSFGSYRLAIAKDFAQVAIEMGNSPAKVREHYHDPKPEADAKLWFSIQPPEAGSNILPLPLEFR